MVPKASCSLGLQSVRRCTWPYALSSCCSSLLPLLTFPREEVLTQVLLLIPLSPDANVGLAHRRPL